MNILFQIRSGFEKGVAGDSIQMLSMMEYISQKGINIDISTSQNVNLKKYDIVHLFNITKINEVYGFYRNAVKQNKKIVVSPIFLDMREAYGSKNIEKLSCWRSYNILRREVLEGCDYIMPNSYYEEEVIKKTMFIDTPSKVIYIGVSNEFEKGNPEDFYNKYKIKDFILCVGRISPIKNQLSLIKALKNLDSQLLLVGPVNNRHYAKACVEESNKHIKYLSFLNHQMLSCAYKAALIHVQPSLIETAGMASLEAGVAGSKIVITNRGATKEYFKDMVLYCQPDNIASIKTSIIKSMEMKKNVKLKKYILENYNWENTALNTINIYKSVVNIDIPRYKTTKKSIVYTNSYYLNI